MEKHIILGVHVTERLKKASDVQAVFTEFGSHIKTRLGLHEVTGGETGSLNGLVLIEWIGDEAKSQSMQDKLNAIGGIEVQRMVFDHA